MLAALAAATQGSSIPANLALAENNAVVAAEVAAALLAPRQHRSCRSLLQPWLPSMRFAFAALRTETGVRRSVRRTEREEDDSCEKHFGGVHEGAWRSRDGVSDQPAEYRRRIKSSAFFREQDFAAALLTAIPEGVCPPPHQRNAGESSSLSSFGTEGLKTDAENPQVNR